MSRSPILLFCEYLAVRQSPMPRRNGETYASLYPQLIEAVRVSKVAFGEINSGHGKSSCIGAAK